MKIKGEDYQPFLSIFFFFFGFGRHIGFWEAADATRSAASFSNRACLSREKTFLDYKLRCCIFYLLVLINRQICLSYPACIFEFWS